MPNEKKKMPLASAASKASKSSSIGDKKPVNKKAMSKDAWKALDSEARKRGTNVTTRDQVKGYQKARVDGGDMKKMQKENMAKKGTNLVSYQQIRETRASKAIDKNPSKKAISPKGRNYLAAAKS
jgi:hypothetical protein